MNYTYTTAYTLATQTIRNISSIRKVKVFPSVRSLTLVTYSVDTSRNREHSPPQQFIGRARTINLLNLHTMTIELEHNSHLPPPEDEATEEEIETEPISLQPAIGCSALSV